jgi:hypothetical protein
MTPDYNRDGSRKRSRCNAGNLPALVRCSDNLQKALSAL